MLDWAVTLFVKVSELIEGVFVSCEPGACWEREMDEFSSETKAWMSLDANRTLRSLSSLRFRLFCFSIDFALTYLSIYD